MKVRPNRYLTNDKSKRVDKCKISKQIKQESPFSQVLKLNLNSFRSYVRMILIPTKRPFSRPRKFGRLGLNIHKSQLLRL